MSENDILFESIKNNNLEQVKQCLVNGADVNARYRYCGYGGYTPLMLALRNENFEIVKCLVEWGADVLVEDVDYWYDINIPTILSRARVRSSEIRQYLSIKVQEAKLADYASQGMTDCVRDCLANGVNANATYKGITALMWACKNGHYEIALTLITAGVDINAKDSSGKTVLNYAAEGGNTEIMKLLLAQDADNGAKK